VDHHAGFADTLVVFAKIDTDRVLSAFIVETKFPGVVIGPDEHKMGIKGSQLPRYISLMLKYLLKTFWEREVRDSGLLSAFCIWEESNLGLT